MRQRAVEKIHRWAMQLDVLLMILDARYGRDCEDDVLLLWNWMWI